MLNRTCARSDSDLAFGEICEKFLALEARKAADEATASFQQAQLIHDARARLKVPLAVMCAALDLSRQSIHTYRNVGERIEEGLFRELVKERRSDGLPLFPWSIIAQVARVADQGERQELIRIIRLRGWRTREVEGYVSVKRGGPSTRLVEAKGDLDREGASPVGDPLTRRFESLLKGVTCSTAPTRTLIAVAEIASRLIGDAADDPACGHSPARELEAAREALRRCATVLVHARNAVTSHLAAAEAQHSGARVSG